MIEYQAAAKINLALHVTGREECGYHTLDTLVTFATYGDVLSVEQADELSLAISGPFSTTLDNHNDNLVLKAARLLKQATLNAGIAVTGASIHLEKQLPIASGIGGGSADAAATLMALCDLWGVDKQLINLPGLALQLGADVPMCLRSLPLRAKGIGERLEEVFLPTLNMVLVNPGVAVSTPDIFRALDHTNSPPLPSLGQPISYIELLRWFECSSNDLELPAISHTAEIQLVLNALLESTKCSFARMSGSGATCFGVYPSAASAKNAAIEISQLFASWWCIPTTTIATDQKM